MLRNNQTITQTFYSLHPAVTDPKEIYIFTGFSEKNVTGSADFPPGCPFLSGRCFALFTGDICWVCKVRTEEATNWPCKIKKNNLIRGRLKLIIIIIKLTWPVIPVTIAILPRTGSSSLLSLSDFSTFPALTKLPPFHATQLCLENAVSRS